MIRAKYVSSSNDYKPLDFGVASTILAVDTATDLAFGHPLQDTFSCDNDLTGYMSGMLQSLPVMQTLAAFPVLINLSTSRLASKLLDKAKDAKTGLGFIYGFARDRTRERYGTNAIPNKKDILGAMVDRGMSLEQAESESLLAAMAGADPVATAVRVNLLHILTNPRVHNRLLAELNGQGLLLSGASSTSNTMTTPYQTLRTLPYLSAVVKESFRIFPPFVGLMEKEVPVGGEYTPDGRFIPTGVVIGTNIQAIQRDTETFGRDAEAFRPERWLECSEEKRVRMERSTDLVFSGGRYTCLGREVAVMEIFKTVFELLRRFEMSIVDPLKP
ncbi:MAG: hypothetical protein Q9190_002263 [Brigantiaea leucoxantha]